MSAERVMPVMVVVAAVTVQVHVVQMYSNAVDGEGSEQASVQTIGADLVRPLTHSPCLCMWDANPTCVPMIVMSALPCCTAFAALTEHACHAALACSCVQQAVSYMLALLPMCCA